MITPDNTSAKPSIGLLLNTMLLCIHEAYRTKNEMKQGVLVDRSEDAKRQAIEQFAALTTERDSWKADAERLEDALISTQDDRLYCLYCGEWAYTWEMKETIHHSPDCPVSLHRQLAKAEGDYK